MSRRAFTSQLAVVLLAALAGLLGEAVACAVRLWSAGAGAALGAAAWSVGVAALPAALGSLALAWLLAAACDEEPMRDACARRWREQPEASRAWLASAALFAGVVFAAAELCLSFHNTQLAAALLTLLVLLAAGVTVVMAGQLKRWAARSGAAARAWLVAAAVLAVVSLATVVLVRSRSGLAQLDARLLLAPTAFFVTLLVADGSTLARESAAQVALGVSSLGLLAGLAYVTLADDGAAARLAAAGAWSPYVVAGLQRASDVDRDGYSSLLGGGDCEPLDADVHPGAAETPGDGIDNNCIGGDSGDAVQPSRPQWGSQAHGSITNMNVVVVTIETFRRDHASFIGSRRDTTPELRKLATESLVFERMYSAAPLTRLALASLFSSYAPSEIDWLPLAPGKRMRRIGPRTPWLPELLRARGFDTYAVLTDFSAFTAQEDAGFERGFEHYDVSTKLQYRGGTMWGFPAREQVDKAIAYTQSARRPFLLWLHLFEPHYNYEQPPDAPRFGGDEQSRYDAEIWHVDRQLGRLVAALKQQGAWDKTVLLVTGDHGEAFGEHDDRWHGSNLHDPQLCPAALLRVPGLVGKRVAEGVTFTDLAPTITRLLGDRQSFDQLRGRSLTPLLHRSRLPEGAGSFVSETFSVDDGHAYQAALVAYPLKLIYIEAGRRFSLYDLSRDPSERAPLDPAADPRAGPLLRQLIGYLERTRPRSLSAD